MNLLARGIFWFGLYVALALMPLLVALVADPVAGGRPFLLELSVALGFVAFALIAFEFALVSRLRAASEPFGTDALMLFHRQMGILALALVAGHVLLLLGRGASLRMLDPFSGPPAARWGAAALWCAVLLVASALLRRRLHLPYEPWRALHTLLALGTAGAMLAHVLAVGLYTGAPSVAAILIGYVALFAALLAGYRLARPLLLRRCPWEVIENRDEGGDTRTLVVRPLGHRGIDFAPGQFAWIATGRSPLTSPQHPISISSSAELGPDRRLELSIKALGDWSRDDVPRIAPGARLWVDGPFGAFSIDRAPAQGFVLIAGGIGITPMRSILFTMRDRGDVRPVILLYGAHDAGRAVFGADLAQLEGSMNLRVVSVYEAPGPDWTGERGFITADLLRRNLPPRLDHWQVFVCGPGPMMDSLERLLPTLGVPRERIHTERFDMV